MAARPLIGIVDDEESVRVALRRLCTAYGLDTLTFGSLEEFAASPAIERLDCVLLDVRLPGLGTTKTGSWLRAHRISAPVIMMTGQDDDEIRQAPRPAGVTDFLFKPVDADVLLGAIRAALNPAAPGGTGRP